MNCLLKIKESLDSFTKNEKMIGNYILENKDDFVYESAQALAKKIGTSAAAIVRFSKKLGYDGLPEFKMALASEGDRYIPMDLTEAIEETDTIEVLKNKTYMNYVTNCEKTYDLIDLKEFETVSTLILKARKIYLFGIGASGVVCMDLYHKLTRLGYEVVYNMDSHTQIASCVHMTKEDICIGISYSGENREVIVPFEIAKENNVPTVAISSIGKNSLTKISDYKFYIPFQERDLRIGAIASRYAALMITDFLYLNIAKTDLKKTRKNLAITKDAIKRLRK